MTNSDWSDGFRSRLELLQGRYGMSKAEMARQCGLPPRTVENYFKGHKPGIEALLSLSRGLAIDLDWLLGEAPEDKAMITDLIGEASSLAARDLLRDIAVTLGSTKPDSSADVFGTPIDAIARQFEAEVVRRYLLLQKQYSAPSLEAAQVMDKSTI